mmetsp:Transcript_6361/g.16576  ORF Transcript_6361/g.16576 Transcript_6361/m.16576 type:complete len:227 (-) Transcript_6361:130-810(-)
MPRPPRRARGATTSCGSWRSRSKRSGWTRARSARRRRGSRRLAGCSQSTAKCARRRCGCARRLCPRSSSPRPRSRSSCSSRPSWRGSPRCCSAAPPPSSPLAGVSTRTSSRARRAPFTQTRFRACSTSALRTRSASRCAVSRRSSVPWRASYWSRTRPTWRPLVKTKCLSRRSSARRPPSTRALSSKCSRSWTEQQSCETPRPGSSSSSFAGPGGRSSPGAPIGRA